MFLKVLLTLLAIAYPVLVYFGLMHFSIREICVVIFFLATIKFLVSIKERNKHDLILFVAVGVLLVFSFFTKESTGILLYPVIINAVLAITFILSLYHPPSMIEKFARLQEPDLPPKAIQYTRQVTKVWAFFLSAMAASRYSPFSKTT